MNLALPVADNILDMRLHDVEQLLAAPVLIVLGTIGLEPLSHLFVPYKSVSPDANVVLCGEVNKTVAMIEVKLALRRFDVCKLHLVLAYHHVEVACYALGFLVVGIVNIDAPYGHTCAHILVDFVGVGAYWGVVGHLELEVEDCLHEGIVILVTVIYCYVALTSVFL